jgi:hypothetical protein
VADHGVEQGEPDIAIEEIGDAFQAGFLTP